MGGADGWCDRERSGGHNREGECTSGQGGQTRTTGGRDDRLSHVALQANTTLCQPHAC